MLALGGWSAARPTLQKHVCNTSLVQNHVLVLWGLVAQGGEQRRQVVRTHLPLPLAAAFQQAARQVGLGLLQVLDLLFDAAAGDQLVDEHRLVLAAIGSPQPPFFCLSP